MFLKRLLYHEFQQNKGAKVQHFCLISNYNSAHPFGLKVLPGCEKYYKTESSTQLVLKEKFWSLSGDSCSVKDENGKVWFRIKGQALSLHGKSTLLDAKYGLPNAKYLNSQFIIGIP